MSALVQGFPPAQIPEAAELLRSEVRSFLAVSLPSLPDHERVRTWSGFDAPFSRALAKHGFVGMTLPQCYGGGGRDAFARFVVAEELLSAGAPIAAHWIADRQSGPLLLRLGTEEQRRTYLPRICRGEAFFCIGMSEPNSGSDLASVRSRAAEDNGSWILNGSKIWTTFAHKSDFMIALVRTTGRPEDRQHGLSQFIIDLKLPGVTIRPIRLMTGDSDFSEVIFQDVRLPRDALIGTEGKGWEQVNAELAFERSGPERLYSSGVLLDYWANSLRHSNDSLALTRLGRFMARLATLRAMSLAVTERLTKGESPALEAAIVKDLGTTLEQDIVSELADAAAASPDVEPNPALLRSVAFLLQFNHVFSLRGGTREILRGMIARALGLR